MGVNDEDQVPGAEVEVGGVPAVVVGDWELAVHEEWLARHQAGARLEMSRWFERFVSFQSAERPVGAMDGAVSRKGKSGKGGDGRGARPAAAASSGGGGLARDEGSLPGEVVWERVGRDWRLLVPYAALMKFEELGYERLMPAVDGRKERAIGMRLHRIARDVREKPTAVMGEPSAGFLTWLGTEYMGLGSCHYQLVPPRSNAALADKNPDGNWHENWAWRSEQCVLAGDADGAWACAMVLKGRPVAFTDCILKPLYSLKKQGEVLQKVLEVKARTRQWVVELPGTALD